ncbi:MAG TPA: hypothetical protein VE131_05555, partial [Terriglobales bacterium]|nr:hypothetical protein [Terriglobales bacterium]
EIPALQAVKAITLKASIRALRLGLYDEKNKKLVGFSRIAKNNNPEEHVETFKKRQKAWARKEKRQK